MRTRAFGMVLAVALMFVTSAPAVAQQAKCLAGKTKCVVKKGTGLLKCHTLAETPGKPADPNADGCIDKVVGQVRRRRRADEGLLREAREQERQRLHHASTTRPVGRGARSTAASPRSSTPSIPPPIDADEVRRRQEEVRRRSC